MRIACQVFVLLSAGLLVSCAPPIPSETVQLSRPSAFDTPLDHRWRKASETRPVAVLLGRAETSRVLFPRKAVLRVSCYRKPTVRVSYDVGLKSGPIAVAYRFDAKTEQKGVVRVRGTHRNMLVIDNPPAAVAFQAELRNSSTLKVEAARLPFDLYNAFFRWDPNDKVLAEALAACNERMLNAAGRQQPDADDDVADDDIRDVLPED